MLFKLKVSLAQHVLANKAMPLSLGKFAVYHADCAALVLLLCVLHLMRLPFSSECERQV